MGKYGKHIGFGLSLLLFLAVVPYAVLEWFDKTIPFSASLYILSGFSILLLIFNGYYFFRKD